MPDSMHRLEANEHHFVDAALRAARRRIEADLHGELPLGDPRSAEQLDDLAGRTITATGIGAAEALRLWTEVLEPSCLSTDHHGYLAFVPQAPSEVAVIADLLVSASSVYGGSWLEGSGAVWAENQALRWIADLAGLPASAGGAFAPGGTLANLSALVAARDDAPHRPSHDPRRVDADGYVVVCGEHAHASVADMARVAGMEARPVRGDRLRGPALREALADPSIHGRVAAVVATAGTTNLGRVDPVAEVADVCEELDLWLHVDGAYGLAAMAVPWMRPRFAGVERADSLVVDPHKWLFSPFDCAALLYRDPAKGRASHTQRAGYLDTLNVAGDAGDWNPSDYQVGLTRRTRGVPLWFALAVHGTEAFATAIASNLDLAAEVADLVQEAPHLDLVERPDLSVVAFRVDGWEQDDYDRWSDHVLEAELGLVVASDHDFGAGAEPIVRLCFLNPRTTIDHVTAILSTIGAA